ncbi:MAG: anti-sigma F factor [Clostridia bacterium]|nr:anti-sigma F factor [Clostridia bacterium]
MNSLASTRRTNELKAEFLSKSENESFARMIVAAFIAPLDPTIEELSDIRTAVSEAVTNAIVHGYSEKKGNVYLECTSVDNDVTITVKDYGKGIEDVARAMEPMFTTNPDMERSGMGFTVMETFMDKILVDSIPGVGTKVVMTKKIGANRL